MPDSPIARDLYLLDPDVVFLNHGSFGACPRPVFEAYQRWQLELERQPVEFLGRRSDALLDAAAARLAEYIGAEPGSVVFTPNTTTGINTIARSLHLEPGDEILCSNHEYGAIEMTWQFIADKTGARLVRQPIPLPVTTHDDALEAFWAGVTGRTRVICISHLTSPTAIILPVAAVCARARERGILCVVDGAHAPGQLPLDVRAIGADAYVGNLHKWLSSAKGSAFLYARPERQRMLEPLVISWGWKLGAAFADQHRWQGTRDVAAFLSVPAAVDFQAEHNWDAVRAACHALASDARRRLAELTGLDPIVPDDPAWFAQMIAAPLPPVDTTALKDRLYDEYRVEIPIIVWEGRALIRAAYQGYNSAADTDR
ncbi:MAG: aminotransferase class V-fold PLP-dependent enzyme, partial [Anaerolineae bacterium]|nr:aminotransferase class V-fold PLP-dependent enzyme [Anaerolineae bacterium]